MADKAKRPAGLLPAMGIAAFLVLGVFLALGVDFSIGAGLLMFGFVSHGVYNADRRGTGEERSLAQRRLVGVVLGSTLVAAFAFVTYLEFNQFMVSLCIGAKQEPTRRMRKAAYDEVTSYAWLAHRFNQDDLASCFGDAYEYESRR